MKKLLRAAPLAAWRWPAAAPAPRAGLRPGQPLQHSPRLVAQRQRLQAAFGTAFAPPAPAGQPVQRKIMLAGEPSLRDTNLADLNRMLAGIHAQVAARPSGEVYFAIRPRRLKGTEHEGFRLVQSLVDHRHTVTIGYSADKDDAKAKADNVDAASKKRQGSGSYLNLSEAFKTSDLVQDATGAIREEATPRHMVLAHELIHARHYAQGRRATKGRVEYPVTGTFEGKPLKNASYGSREEEVNTVGLAPDPRDTITENALRKRLGMPTRPLYEADMKGATDWLRGKTDGGATEARTSGTRTAVRPRRGSDGGMTKPARSLDPDLAPRGASKGSDPLASGPFPGFRWQKEEKK